MKPDELDVLIDGREETPSLDFKAACDWSVQTFAKDILAMSNVQDGGQIIVGVEDGTFTRQGMTPSQLTTFNIETMRDQMTRFADPHVNFTSRTVIDLAGKSYISIQVQPFAEIPVICRSSGPGLQLGALYYRNRNRRVESAPVSNSHDMRDILDRAAVKLMQRYRDLGLKPQADARSQFEAELGGI
ncbi:MAG: ATP-binding protein [Rhodospirillaceae bacterium]